jgi:hypothetical protein
VSAERFDQHDAQPVFSEKAPAALKTVNSSAAVRSADRTADSPLRRLTGLSQSVDCPV